jgi:hypothetical protein
MGLRDQLFEFGHGLYIATRPDKARRFEDENRFSGFRI